MKKQKGMRKDFQIEEATRAPREVKAQAGMNTIMCPKCKEAGTDMAAFIPVTLNELAKWRAYFSKAVKGAVCPNGHRIEVTFH